MLYQFIHDWLPSQTLANLFRYITFRAALAAFVSFSFVVFFMPAFIRWLRKRRVKQIVRDDGPQTHKAKEGTPTMGGLMMVLGIAFSTLLLARLDQTPVWIALFCLLSFGSVGFLDDYLKLTARNTKGVSFRAKMISLGIFCSIAVAFAIQTNAIEPEIHIPFLKDWVWNIGLWFYLWAYLVLVGASNAVNLTDGLDGLAIVPIMTTGAVLLVMSYITGHLGFSAYLQFEYLAGVGELAVMMAALIGVGLGFLWYNSHPASVFMGDVGSLALGGLLGAVALLTHKEIVLLIAGFLFVLEAVSVMLQVGSYKLRKVRIFKMAPLHHHFELSGWPESKVIVRFWILSLLFALAALTTLKLR